MRQAERVGVLAAAVLVGVGGALGARGGEPIVWTGAVSNQWTVGGDANFLDGGVPRAFASGDAVAFTDAPTNLADVVLQGNLSVSGMTVAAARDYRFLGGSISAAGGWTKSGTGTLTLGNGIRVFGPVAVTGGTLVVPNLDFLGTLATGSNAGNLLLDGGTLRYSGPEVTTAQLLMVGTNGATIDSSGSGSLTFKDPNAPIRSLALGGSGARTLTLTGSAQGGLGFKVGDAGGPTSIVKDGTGTWAMSLDGTFTGGVTVKAGLLRTGGSNAGGTNVTVVVEPGASLDAVSSTEQRIIVSGAGVGGAGALVQNVYAPWGVFHDVTLAGDTTVGGTYRLDLNRTATLWPRLSTGGQAYKLTKVGLNQFTLQDTAVDSALGDIDIREGSLSVELDTSGLGDPAKTMTIGPAGTFMMWNAAHPVNKRIVANGGGIWLLAGTNSALLGDVTLTAPTTVTVENFARLTMSGAVSGGSAGGLIKARGGTLELTGANTYSGATTVAAGTLRVSGSIANSAVTVKSGGTLEAAGSPRVRGLAVEAGGAAVIGSSPSAGAPVVLTVGDGTGTASPLSVATGVGSNGGRVDVAFGGMIVDGGAGGREAALVGVRDAIVSAYAGGTWAGNGVTSSATAGGAAPGMAVGYAAAGEVAGAAGGSFMGAPVGADAVVVRATLAGDADLDGRVNFGDLLALAKHYNAVFDGATPGWWSRGDFNYDGRVNFADLLLLAKDYNGAAPGGAVAGAPAGFGADVAAAFAQAVPEPSGVVGVLVAGGVGLAGRRRGGKGAGSGGERR